MIWLLVLCLLASPLLSALEAALLAASRVRIEHAAGNSRKQRLLRRLAADPRRILASVLVLNTMSNLLAFALLTLGLVRWLGPWGYVVAFACGLPLYLFFGELLPKAIARFFPYRFLTFFVPALGILYYLPGWLFAPLSRPQNANLSSRDCFREREDLKALTDAVTREGLLGEKESLMIRNILAMRSLRAGEVLRPLKPEHYVRADESCSVLLSRASAEASAAVPVVDDALAPRGWVDLDAVVRNGHPERRVSEFLKRCPIVPSSEPLEALVSAMRADGAKLALVLREPGTAPGVIAMADLTALLLRDGSEGEKLS